MQKWILIFLLFKVSYSWTQTNSGTSIQSVPCSGTISTDDIREDWRINMRHISTYFHNSELSIEEYKRLKDEANSVRLHPNVNQAISLRNSSQNDPVLASNFKGNQRENSIPMDNSMAVSRNGFVVSAINSNLIFTLQDGTVTFSRSLSDFFKILSLGTHMFDPRVIYDPEQDRFIVVTLHSSSPPSSYICIAVSKTEDPNGEWNFYKVKGDQEENGVWFDFPNIALSQKDFFIAGNMFTSEGTFRYSTIFQISKEGIYAGEDMVYKSYSDIKNVDQGTIFNPVPVMSGWKNLTNKMYFISIGGGGFNLHYVDLPVAENAILEVKKVSGPTIAFPPEAKQKGTDVVLNTGGTRIRCAIIQNDVIHFASQTNTPSGNVGIYYGRLYLSKDKVYRTILADPEKDLAYPTLTSFGREENSEEFLLNYTYAGENVFPGQAVRLVCGSLDTFYWSNEVVTKLGSTPIGTTADASVRWGDYSGACRRFLDDRVESWICGTYGMANAHNTWIAQLLSEEDFESPILDFSAYPTSALKDSVVTFSDLSNAIPLKREWLFPGGTPDTSTAEKPQVAYSEYGDFNVTLIHHYVDRVDTMHKIKYIHTFEPETKPIANWESDKDTIYVGESVLFSNLSSENTKYFQWHFFGGTPNSSDLPQQEVTYPRSGKFVVSLTAINAAGNNTLIKPNAITVLEKLPPVANFKADKVWGEKDDTIHFTNLSKFAKKFAWSFEGGFPESSLDEDPVVIYDNLGSFDVQLIVTNDFGSDTILYEDYIKIETSSTKEKSPLFHTLKLKPNPTILGQITTLYLDIIQSENIEICLLNQNGQFVKLLYDDVVKSGKNELTFNSGMLSKGTYFIRISDKKGFYKVVEWVII